MSKPEPAIIVIFGITGDLAQRKLLPALYHLLKDGLLDERSVILGISRRDTTVDELLRSVELCVNEIDKTCDPEGLRKVHASLRMHQMDPTDDAAYQELKQLLETIETEQGICMNRLYYLSIPPQTFSRVVQGLGQNGLNQSCDHGSAASRLLVEKPFGYDLASARELIHETSQHFNEDQIFRIDHYLAKETVQNILTFRMFNPIFSDLWNNQHIESITITAFEKIDIEGRAGFYDEVGALRDFVQSHLLQLLAIVAMDLPESLDSTDVHATKLRLLESITAIRPDEVGNKTVRGQYIGYRQEIGKPESMTETYAAVTLAVDSPPWQGVPMTLRTGKAMDEKRTDVRVRFREQSKQDGMYNDLLFRIQPSEGISLDLYAKKPGYLDVLEQVVMEFNYHNSFDSNGHPDAYERVLIDAMRGDHTLFTTSQEVLAAWQAVDSIIPAWQQNPDSLIMYKKGSETLDEVA